MKQPTLKEVFTSTDWIITKIIDGIDVCRVDARRRNRLADGVNYFSRWGSTKYLNRLAMEGYGKKLKDFYVFS